MIQAFLEFSKGSVRAGALSPRVQVPNNHILFKILTYITTILNLST